MVQRAWRVVVQAVTQPQDLLLTRIEHLQHVLELLGQHLTGGGFHRLHRILVRQQVPDLGIAVLADGRLQRDREAGGLFQLANLILCHLHLGRDLAVRRLAPEP